MSIDPRDNYIAQVVEGKSFLEVGGLWGGLNEKVSIAHKYGANRLAILDVAPPESEWWDFFRERMAQIGVKYDAFIGDICTVNTAEIGAPFDIVHCSGVLYHLPNPMLMLTVLRSITKEYLILTSAVTPEVLKNENGYYALPPSGVIFVPALSDTERNCLKTYWTTNAGVTVARGITEAVNFSTDNFGAWWWLPTATALRAMCCSAGFQVIDSQPFWNNNALTLLLR